MQSNSPTQPRQPTTKPVMKTKTPKGPRYMPNLHNLYPTNFAIPQPAPPPNHTLIPPDEQMPYYVVPVLYVPKQIVPPETLNIPTARTGVPNILKRNKPSTTTSPTSRYCQPSSAPGRMQMRTESSLQRSVEPQKPVDESSVHTSVYYVNQRLRNTAVCTANPALGRVIEEHEHERVDEVVVPTRDVTQGSKGRNKKSLRKRDTTIQDLRRQLMEALEIVERFQGENKEYASKGTQYESSAVIEKGRVRPFTQVLRLEESLKKMRK